MQRHNHERELNRTPEIQVPFSGFTPLNTSSSPPGGIYHTKDVQPEHQPKEVQSPTQKHNVHLARHLGLGTDQIPTPLATLDRNGARGKKKGKTPTQAKGKGPNASDNKDPEAAINAAKYGQAGGHVANERDIAKNKRDMIMQEFFPESKAKAGNSPEPDGKSAEGPLLTLPADNSVPVGYDGWQDNADEAPVLPADFDSDQLLSDAELEDILNEPSNNLTNDPSVEDETDHITDSIGEMDDDELFETFINYPPVVDDDGDEEFDGFELPDEEMVELLDCSVESQQRAEEVDFDDSWVDELDEADIELLTPCSMPR